MAVSKLSSLTTKLVEVITTNDAALVIGAGASVTSGGPTSLQLVDKLRHRFPLAEVPPTMSLLDAGTLICDTDPYGRVDLFRYVVDELAPLQQSDAYKQLPRLRWLALFTTNYDDLIE